MGTKKYGIIKESGRLGARLANNLSNHGTSSTSIFIKVGQDVHKVVVRPKQTSNMSWI